MKLNLKIFPRNKTYKFQFIFLRVQGQRQKMLFGAWELNPTAQHFIYVLPYAKVTPWEKIKYILIERKLF